MLRDFREKNCTTNIKPSPSENQPTSQAPATMSRRPDAAMKWGDTSTPKPDQHTQDAPEQHIAVGSAALLVRVGVELGHISSIKLASSAHG